MTTRIKFIGNKDDGYSASTGWMQCKVWKDGNKWKASYSGRPAVHNPWVKGARSCMCPTIVLNTSYSSRRSAALAALTLMVAEDAACEAVRRGESSTQGFSGIRLMVAEQASVTRP